MLIVCTACGWNREVSKKTLQARVITCPQCGAEVEIPLASGDYLSALLHPTPAMIAVAAGVLLLVAIFVCGIAGAVVWARLY